MPKNKLKINRADLKKFALASEFSDIKIGDSKKMGDEFSVEVSYRSLQDVFNVGRKIDKVTDDDIAAADKAAEAAKQKAAAKAAAEKKK